MRTNLDYVPRRRRGDLVTHLLADVVSPGGRLIIGVFTEETDCLALEESVRSWEFAVAGRTERSHPDTDRLRRRAFWLDATER